MRASAFIACLFVACAGVKAEPEVAVAPAVIEAPPEPARVLADETEDEPEDIAWGSWKGFGPAGCAMLAPEDGAVARDGGVDVVFHFHAGQMSDRDLRASGVRAVIASCGWGVGSTPYARAFEDPRRFERMLRALTSRVGATHVRRLALASWSAGFASIGKILREPRYYAMTDAVVLLDSLHSAHTREGGVDVRMLDPFVRFARDAARGDRAMVITHSAIATYGYASSTEASRALLRAIDVAETPATRDAPDARGMRPSYEADAGGLHVRGFRGKGPGDHFDHLHLVGHALRTWVRPRWKTGSPPHAAPP